MQTLIQIILSFVLFVLIGSMEFGFTKRKKERNQQ
jgi:hypothetical protein